ncbi:hypothetical protein [Alteromonas sp. KUL49]|uniref:hypothetical protein n=1 Tax=Alteromonas sp. KUL49 TaxID=2480798 RepID=UPI00102F18F2|nr:hypothetical protein [Alteromonas sp. KUL49]TAP42606.1 hypothetical protein EYS00_03070 [Alteromonas sp. KUL49]GEA10246.1 hypothetical protein KUL49_06210 [Alteromonas sp. KUL49]
MKKLLVCLVFAFISLPVFSASSRYEAVADNYEQYALDEPLIENAKMQGECLVQLKELTFKKKNEFDPISEWVNYRSVSLLEQYSPCEVLIMLEVANDKIRQGNL